MTGEISTSLEDYFDMTEITITLPLPPSMNHYWRRVGRKTLISAKGREFKADCETMAKMQRVEKFDGEVAVDATIYMARLGCDLDNRIKPLLDALNGIAYDDDGQVSEIRMVRGLDRGNPRVEVTLRAA